MGINIDRTERAQIVKPAYMEFLNTSMGVRNKFQDTFDKEPFFYDE